MLNLNFFPIDYLALFASTVIMFGLYIFIILRPDIGIKEYTNIQKTHSGSISRLGGFVCIVGMVSYTLIADQLQILDNMKIILLSSIPFLLASLKEDLYLNTSPVLRLLSMFFSLLLLFNYYEVAFPVVDIPIIGDLIHSNQYTVYIFYFICATTLMNGINIIDGVHGLAALTVIFQCLSLSLIMVAVSDYYYLPFLFIIIFTLTIFLIFNFPFGKIFLGDSGAYFYGFLISVIVIDFFGRNQNLISWNTLIFLFYPFFEVIFSFARKLYLRRSPFKPDREHLHLLIFFSLHRYIASSKFSNPLTTMILCFFWVTPTILLIISYTDKVLIISCFVFLVITYLITYNYFLRLYLKKKIQ